MTIEVTDFWLWRLKKVLVYLFEERKHIKNGIKRDLLWWKMAGCHRKAIDLIYGG